MLILRCYVDTVWQNQNHTGWEELQTLAYPGGEGQYSGFGLLQWFCGWFFLMNCYQESKHQK